MFYLEFLKKYMRIVDFWLLCKMWKGPVVWPGLDFDRQVGIDSAMNSILDARINVLRAKQLLSVRAFLKTVTHRHP